MPKFLNLALIGINNVPKKDLIFLAFYEIWILDFCNIRADAPDGGEEG